MATIDEIMGEVQAFACTWALVGGSLDDGSMYNTAEAQSAELREAIKAAIAEAWVAGALSSKVTLGEAERRGAEQMREAAAVSAWSRAMDLHAQWRGMPVCTAADIGSDCAEAIRSIPLPNESEP